MAVLGRLLVSSAERLDLPDFLSIDSYTQGDFKYLMKSFVGDEKPFVLKGFEVINPANTIGTQNIAIKVANSVVYYPGSAAGPFFYGLEEGNIQAAPLIPELRKNSTNYVYLVLTTAEAAKDTRAFWDPDKNNGDGGEFTQDVNTQTLLSAQVNVSVSSFPANTIPICKVVVGSNFIESIEDARDMMFRLGSGGIAPDILNRHSFKEDPTSNFARKEPNIKMSSALDPNPFLGGDKNIHTLKEWMDVVMTKFAELGGSTYWYEDLGAFNIVNVFKDALATSVKSKGAWASSDAIPGNLIWTDDILIQSTLDKRDIILRAGNKTLNENQVMFIERIRDVAINTSGLSVNWIKNALHVNGPIGSFENLSKGDWIKKVDDGDARYVRVEEFYLGLNQSGGVASPSTARSIKLSEPYAGTTESKYGVYTKGIYQVTDVSVTDRNDPSISEATGNFYWLAMRSDTVMAIDSIVTTTLSCDIADHDGQKALVTSTNHGLEDSQQITISGSTNFNGTYSIEVETSDKFYIYKSGTVLANESGVNAHYATITTKARSTANGMQLESANHGFRSDETITISGTSNYDDDAKIFVKTPTSFTIAVPTATAPESVGLVTATEMFVRTESRPLKLQRGESKEVGAPETENLMSFIGMDSITQFAPNYDIPSNYNTIHGYVDYNSDSSDNLTARVAKLTAMMANKAQDKTVTYKLTDVQAVERSDNAGLIDVTFKPKLNGTPTLEFIQPSSKYSVIIALAGKVSLGANQVAYVSLNRNGNTSVPNLSALSIVDIEKLPLTENIFIFALRLADDSIILWDRTPVREYLTIMEDLGVETETFTLPPASSITSGEAFTINSALDEYEYYGWFNKDGVGGNPLFPGKIGIEIPVNSGDSNLLVATSFNAAINAQLGLSSNNNGDGTVTVQRTSAGRTTSSANVDVGGIFSIVINSEGSGSTLNYIDNGDLVETALKKLDEKLFEVENALPDQAYEETLDIISSTASNSNELEGPIASGVEIRLPLDSRYFSVQKSYIVGEGQLEVFLNGQYLSMGVDWAEVGNAGEESVKIKILQDLVVTDSLLFRLDNITSGGNTSGNGGGSDGSEGATTASNVGSGAASFKVKLGDDLQFRSIVGGAGVTVTQNINDITITSVPSTANASVMILNGTNAILSVSDDVVIVRNSGNDVFVTLPTAIGNTGKIFNVKKADSGNAVKVKTVLNQTIDGVNSTSSSIDIVNQYVSLTFVSDGANWHII